MSGASIIFFLPDSVTSEEAYSLWQDQEIERYEKGVILPHLSKLKETIRRPTKILDIIRRCPRSTTIVLWNLSQAGNLERFNVTLLSRRFDSVIVRVLKPNLFLDPSSHDSAQVLEALSIAQKMHNGSPYRGEDSPYNYGTPKTADHIIANMIDDRKAGLSYNMIAKKHKVSVSTAIKYTEYLQINLNKPAAPVPIKSVEKSPVSPQRMKLPIDNTSVLFSIIVAFLHAQRSTSTQHAYYYDFKFVLEWFCSQYGKIDHPSFFNADNLEAFLKHLKEKKTRLTMILKRMSTLSSFFKYCVLRDLMAKNYVDFLMLPKKESHNVLANPLSETEINKIINLAFMKYKSETAKNRKAITHRNLLAFYLLASCGMRVGALCAIRKMDIHSVDGVTTLALNAKKRGDKYTISLDEKTATMLDDYLNLYFANADGESYIIFSRYPDSGNELTRHDINAILSSYCDELGIKDRKISAHSFRVSYATIATKKADLTLKELQSKMGHRNIQQTAAYIKLADKPIEVSWLPTLDMGLDGKRDFL